jgi:hypothetical protein
LINLSTALETSSKFGLKPPPPGFDSVGVDVDGVPVGEVGVTGVGVVGVGVAGVVPPETGGFITPGIIVPVTTGILLLITGAEITAGLTVVPGFTVGVPVGVVAGFTTGVVAGFTTGAVIGTVVFITGLVTGIVVFTCAKTVFVRSEMIKIYLVFILKMVISDY